MAERDVSGPAGQELIESYLQSDAPLRAEMFRSFLKALKALAAREGRQAASVWARRAVSPDLDYSSLLALGKLARPDGTRQLGGPNGDLRLAVLGGPTTTQLVELLGTFLAGRKIPHVLYEADYGLFRQEILAPGSGLDHFEPRVVFLATGARDVARLPEPNMGSDEVRWMVDDETADWARLWATAHERWGATVVQNLFEIGPWSTMGHFSVRHPACPENYRERLNQAFAEQAPAYVILHDARQLVCEFGAREWFDQRFYWEAKMPCGPTCLPAYAHSVASLVGAAIGRSRKVLVLDLDNTLWGGVLGDVGVEGIRVGQGSGESEAFAHFQRFAKALRARGILLAVCSKNYESNARRAFEARPEMPLGLDDFSCFVANWNNKADNLREIAMRLDLGLDSLVFVDDNPAERGLVRRLLPEVAVPDLPEDPAGYVQAVCKHRYFETVSYTAEDASRARYYEQNAQRRELAASTGDIEAFLASLEMRAKVEPVGKMNLERVAQLVNKSNQFNLTTRRRTAAEIDELAAREEWATLAISLADKLGDNGLISVLFAHGQGDDLVIDTWLMSCRVLQRGVEQFALNQLVEVARRSGCRRLLGAYIPTDRNQMVREHYPRLGFQAEANDGETTWWSLDAGESFQPQATLIQRDPKP